LEIHLFYNLLLFYWHFLEILWLFIFLVFYKFSFHKISIKRKCQVSILLKKWFPQNPLIIHISHKNFDWFSLNSFIILYFFIGLHFFGNFLISLLLYEYSYLVMRLVFWNSIHLEVASDPFCLLINSSWLLVFIFIFFSLLESIFNLYCWKGIHFS